MGRRGLPGRGPSPRRAIAVAYVTAIFMTAIDMQIVNVALPTLSRKFNAPLSDVQWTVIAYLLTLAVVIPASGWIGDRIGTKRTFLFALALFTAASALCGAADSLPELIAARALQGIGGGMLTPTGTAMLYRAYGRLVFSIAYRILGDTGRSEEATQTAFTKLWQAAARVDPDRDVRPLLFTIVRRTAYDMSESSRRQNWTPLEDIAEPSVDDGLDRLSTEWQVRQAVDSLPEDEREIVRLQHLEGMTHTEVAEHLGLPVGTVKSRSFRAHKRLLSLLGPLREEVA